jgi:uncharacterized membrane protein YeaQ/YmgE (transglycosylase-associated protein family)
MELRPGGIISWIVVGLLAGWLTGKLVRGSGYGLLGDIGLGLLGALVGGFVVGLFFHGDTGFLGSIVVATIGAVILVLLVRTLSGRRI